jgi:hypothetical protein
MARLNSQHDSARCPSFAPVLSQPRLHPSFPGSPAALPAAAAQAPRLQAPILSVPCGVSRWPAARLAFQCGGGGSQWRGEPRVRQGAMACVSGLRLDTAGHRRFSGAQQVLGADVWRASEKSEALILMDGWCGAHTADTTCKNAG